MKTNLTFSQIARIITDDLGSGKARLSALKGAFRLRIKMSERAVHNLVTSHGWSMCHVKQNARDIFINPLYDSVHLAISLVPYNGHVIDICRNDDENENTGNFVERARWALRNILPKYRVHNQNPLRQYLQIKDKSWEFVSNKLHEAGWSVIEQRGSTHLWSHPNHTDITMFLENDGYVYLTATHQSVDGCANPTANRNESVDILASIFGGNVARRTGIVSKLRTAAPDEALVNINIDNNWLDLVKKAGWYMHGINSAGEMFFFNGEDHPGYVLRTFSLDGFAPESDHKEGVAYIGIQVKPMERLRTGEINEECFANKSIKVLRSFFPAREIIVHNKHYIAVNVDYYLLSKLVTILDRHGWVKTSDAENEDFSYQNQAHPGLLITIGTTESDNVSAFMHITPTWTPLAELCLDPKPIDEVDVRDDSSEEMFPEADIDEAEKRNLDRLVLAIQRHVSEEEAPHRKGRKVFFARGAVMHEVLELVDVAMFSCDHYSDGLIQDMERTTKKRVAYIGVMEGVKFSLREKKSGKIVLKARGTSKHVLA